MLLCRAQALKRGRADPSPPATAAPSPAAALDLNRLEAWASARQAAVEGGFCGRTGKLADGCYSFWQGALFPLLVEARAFARLSGPSPGAREMAREECSPAEGGCGVPELPECLKAAAGVCGVASPREPTAAWAQWSRDGDGSHRREEHAEHVRSCSLGVLVFRADVAVSPCICAVQPDQVVWLILAGT